MFLLPRFSLRLPFEADGADVDRGQRSTGGRKGKSTLNVIALIKIYGSEMASGQFDECRLAA